MKVAPFPVPSLVLLGPIRSRRDTQRQTRKTAGTAACARETCETLRSYPAHAPAPSSKECTGPYLPAATLYTETETRQRRPSAAAAG